MTLPQNPALPPELWALVMQYCSLKTLKSLAIVSRDLCEEARRYMYHTIKFGKNYWVPKSGSATQIRDIALFRESLSTWPGWRFALHNAYLHCDKRAQYDWKEAADESESCPLSSTEKLVQEVALLMSESRVLDILHISMSHLNSTLPFVVPRLNSLTIPINGCLYNDPDFPRLMKLFRVPSLDRIELHSMLRLNCTLPADCLESGISNVTYLKFTNCGPVSKEISDLLRWPKDLQTLHIFVNLADGLNRYAYNSGANTMTGVLEALAPLKKTLRDFQIDITYDGAGIPDCPLQGPAFESFERLRLLRVPLEMFLEFFDDDDSITTLEAAPPAHTRLPHSLEELILEAGNDLPWYDYDRADEDFYVASREAIELFTWLGDLAEYKFSHFPNLRQLRIWSGGDFKRLKPAGPDPHAFPLVSEYTGRFPEMLEEVGIAVEID